MYQEEDAVRNMIRRRREEKRARVIIYAAVANVATIAALIWFIQVNLR